MYIYVYIYIYIYRERDTTYMNICKKHTANLNNLKTPTSKTPGHYTRTLHKNESKRPANRLAITLVCKQLSKRPATHWGITLV